MNLKFKTEVSSDLEQVKQGFDRSLFLQLKPPLIQLVLDRFDGCEVGDEIHLRVGLPGALQTWVSRITFHHLDEDSWSFVDEGDPLPFPLRQWRHHHGVRRLASGGAEISDEISFSCGNRILDLLILGPLWLSFAGRASVYRRVFRSS